MNEQSTESRDPQWAPCPAGCLTDLRQTLRWRTRKSQILAATSVLTVLVCLAGTAWFGLQTRTDAALVVHCPECRDSAKNFLAGKLPAAQHEAIVVHLEHCQSCRSYYEEQASAPVMGARGKPSFSIASR